MGKVKIWRYKLLAGTLSVATLGSIVPVQTMAIETGAVQTNQKMITAFEMSEDIMTQTIQVGSNEKPNLPDTIDAAMTTTTWEEESIPETGEDSNEESPDITTASALTITHGDKAQQVVSYTATTTEEKVAVPVKWVLEDAKTYSTATEDVFNYRAVIQDEQYKIASKVAMPTISVNIVTAYDEPSQMAVVGDLTVTGGVLDTDYTYTSNVLTIKTATPLTLSGTTKVDRIVVPSGVTANIILEDIAIDTSEIGTAIPTIEIMGNANIALADGSTNTLKSTSAAIKVDENASVTIDGDTGALTTLGGSRAAGIGSTANKKPGEITINGGVIVAKGGAEGSGIGGGSNAPGNKVTINDGHITATGGIYVRTGAGAGIGAGRYQDMGEIIINGGEIIATGGSGSNSQQPGPGIGARAGTGKIIINDGDITAIGGKSGAPGLGDANIEVIISDKVEYAVSRYALPTTGFIQGTNAATSNIGTMEYVKVRKYVLAPYDISVVGGVQGTDYTYEYINSSDKQEGRVLTVLTDEVLTLQNRDGISTTIDKIKVPEGVTANIILDGVAIDMNQGYHYAKSPFEVLGDVNITLADDSINTFKTSCYNTGMRVGPNASLSIDGQTQGTGILQAISVEEMSGSNGAAGIGGWYGQEVGTITINGGIVHAQGSEMGNGIGPGVGKNAKAIEITGGTVTAIGGNGGAGSGISGGGTGDITISGGDVTATGGNGGAGSGIVTTSGTINISDGTVVATGGENSAGANTNGGHGIGALSYGEPNEIMISGGDVTATGGGLGGMGIAGNTITISDGTIVAVAGERGNGITGPIYDGESTADITISGGNVTATGGGGDEAYHPGHGHVGQGIGGEIHISGGNVNTTGGSGRENVGGGSGIGGSELNISGGIIDAMGGMTTASYNSAGSGISSDKVIITDGIVTAIGADNTNNTGGKGIGNSLGARITITGGTVTGTGGAGAGDSKAVGIGGGNSIVEVGNKMEYAVQTTPILDDTVYTRSYGADIAHILTHQYAKVRMAGPSKETDITWLGGVGEVLYSLIDRENHTVTIRVLKGTDITALTPNISVSMDATISPESGTTHDFTTPVIYTVTAEDTTVTQDWTVSVQQIEKGVQITPTTVTGEVGEHLGNLTAIPVALSDTVYYQWYRNTTPSTTGGTPIGWENNQTYYLPTDLAEGTYYYYVTAMDGLETFTSEIATVIVGDELTDKDGIDKAKELIEDGTYAFEETVANTVEDSKKEIANQIGKLDGMDETGIVIKPEHIIIEDPFTPAKDGVDGGFNFTVTIEKGSEQATTTSKPATIIAIPVQNVTGQVVDETGKGVADVTVTIIVDDEEKTATTDKDGNYNMTDIPEGIYTVIVEKDDKQQTSSVVVEGDTLEDIIFITKGDKHTSVEKDDAIPSVAVGNLENMFDGTEKPEDKVALTLTIQEDKNPEDQDIVEQGVVGQAVIGMYIDVELLKTVTPAGGTETTTSIQPPNNEKLNITITLPDAHKNKGPYKIVRVEEGILKNIPVIHNAAYNTLTFEVDTLQTYIYTYTDATIPVHTLTATGTNQVPSGEYAEGDKITIDAGSKEGHTFVNWTTDNGGSFEDATCEVTTFEMPNTDVTIIANWKQDDTDSDDNDDNDNENDNDNDDDTSSNNGILGGSSSNQTPDVDDTEDGTIHVTPSKPNTGDDVTITTKPDVGYEVGDVVVTDKDGKELEVTDNGDNTYTFEQPDGKVTITVTFEKLQDDGEMGVALNKADHIVYMYGVGDEKFEANRGITRAEVVAMFSRLMEQKMASNQTYPSTFTDIEGSAWYANAVGYMEQFDIVSGYEDGTFKPNQAITRAEFAAIVSRFEKYVLTDKNTFTDVDDAHWATAAINSIAAQGFVSGYEDGTFRPTQNITRAEAVVIVNNMLDRTADTTFIEDNIADITTFKDVTSSHWAYYPILEATNAHEHTMSDDKEIWTDLK